MCRSDPLFKPYTLNERRQMFSYLRQGPTAKFGELQIHGTSMVMQGQEFPMADLKFSVWKVEGTNNIVITVRKKRFVKKGKIYVGERPLVSDSGDHGSAVGEIHEGWGDGSGMAGQEPVDQQSESSGS